MIVEEEKPLHRTENIRPSKQILFHTTMSGLGAKLSSCMPRGGCSTATDSSRTVTAVLDTALG